MKLCKRRLILITVTSLFSISIFAQARKEKFGDVSKEELAIKSCEFDKDAQAMVLFNIGKTFCYSFSSPLTTSFDLHKRLKIIGKKGFNEADIKIYIPADKGKGNIKKLRATTYNIDDAGNIKTDEVEAKSFYKKNVDKYTTEISFTFPNVKVGSVLEYAYTYESNGLELERWRFQENIPTLYSAYEINFPVQLIINAASSGIYQPFKKIKDDNQRTITTYELTNAVAIVREPYMTNTKDYITTITPMIMYLDSQTEGRINLQYNWVGLIDDLMADEDFGVQLKKNIPLTKDLDDSLKLVSQPYDKMKTIFKYVQKNMTWNEINSIWALDGVKNAWRDKKGTLGEINLILINLLKDAKLDARPILLSTIKNGFVNQGYVNTRQFNKVMAYVLIDKEVYVLDATDKLTPIDIIPSSVNFTEGIVINKLTKGGWGWVTAWKEKDIYEQNTNISGFISGDKIKGNANIITRRHAKTERVAAYKDDLKTYEKNYYLPQDGLTIVKKTITNLDNENTPLIEELEIEQKLNNTGEYSYFSLNTLSGIDKNIFSSPDRVSDIFYGYKQKYTLTGSFTLDEGYQFDEKPQNKRFISPDTSISVKRIVEVEGNQINYLIQIEYSKPFYPANEYEIFYNVQKAIYGLLEDQIVIKKIKK